MTKTQRIDFDDLKARADFRTVLTHYGITPGHGDQFKIPCPFHDDSRPSCSVNVGKRVFNCFGCPAEGNVLDFVHRMEARGGEVVSIRQAGLTLAEICGLATGAHEAARKPEGGRRPSGAEERPPSSRDTPGGERNRTEAPVNKPLGFTLKHLVMHEYLRERASPALIEAFGLGFCEKGIMAGRVVIPIHNAAGELVAYAGRWVGPPEPPEGEEKYKLPVGFHKNLELFNLHRVKHCRHLVVVEGYFGTIRLHGERIPAAGLMGNSISEEQVARLKASCPALRFVTVLMDGDAPGRTAGEAVAARLSRHWWTRTTALPDGMQPDTVAENELRALLRR